MRGSGRRRGAWILALTLVAAPLAPGVGRGAQFDYVILFAFESEPDLPRFAHTFATFVRATGEGPCADRYALEAHTISWYPADGDVRLARFCPEPGVNLGLAATFRKAHSLGAHLTRRGPYRVSAGLFERARAQAEAQMLQTLSPGQDHLRVVGQMVPNGLQYRLEAEEGALRAILMKAIEAKQQQAAANAGAGGFQQ